MKMKSIFKCTKCGVIINMFNIGLCDQCKQNEIDEINEIVNNNNIPYIIELFIFEFKRYTNKFKITLENENFIIFKNKLKYKYFLNKKTQEIMLISNIKNPLHRFCATEFI